MTYIPIISALLLLTTIVYISRRIKRRKLNGLLSPPHPPGAWPVLGHLHLLGRDDHTCFTFSRLADKYGGVFSLRLGLQNAVVISSRKAVAEAFTVRDKSFANRPKNSAGELLVYGNSAFGFANGLYWRDMRKLVSSEILSARGMEKMKNLRVSEIDLSIKELYFQALNNQNSESRLPMNMSQWTEQMTLNIIAKALAGKRYGSEASGAVPEEVRRFRRLIRDITFLTGQFVLSDVIQLAPLKWLDLQGHLKSMKRVSEELDGILEAWIDEHLSRRSRGEVGDEEDFIDVMLSTIDDRMEVNGNSKRTIIKATTVNVILGGFDTSSVFLIWALSLLVNHNEVLNRAQQEIDSKIGKERWVQESDLKNLVYLQAIIKETLRLYPPLPLSVPHEVVQDSELCGYFIPEGTLLFTNLWKLHRDPRYWPEPEKFRPERFLSGQAQLDFLGQQFEYIPFGSGRRVCPGITFVAHVGNLALARLIQGFEFATPRDQEVDMSVGLGITIPRANPLEVMVSPRLNSQLYQSLVG